MKTATTMAVVTDLIGLITTTEVEEELVIAMVETTTIAGVADMVKETDLPLEGGGEATTVAEGEATIVAASIGLSSMTLNTRKRNISINGAMTHQIVPTPTSTIALLQIQTSTGSSQGVEEE